MFCSLAVRHHSFGNFTTNMIKLFFYDVHIYQQILTIEKFWLLIYSSRLSKHWILFASSSFISFLDVLRFYSDVVAMPSQKYNPTSALQQQQRNHMEKRRTVIGQFWLLVFTHTSFWCRWKTGLRLAKRPLLTAITALCHRETMCLKLYLEPSTTYYCRPMYYILLFIVVCRMKL